jgi:c-di-GMP-binding flagellar brake protein YcgR
MDLQKIKRKNFRINVKGNAAVSVRINNVPYDVIDLNDGGIGILLSAEDIFVAVGDEFPLELKIQNVVQTLQGRVVHISPAGTEEFLCGIQFLSIDAKMKAKLLDFMEACRKKIFKEE